MEESRREFQELRRVYEHTRGGEKAARLLNTIIAQHAFAMVDLVRMRHHPPSRDALVAKLKDLQERWTNVLLYRAGQNTKNTLDKRTEREYRFQRTVYAMVDEFVQHLLRIVVGGGGGAFGEELDGFITDGVKRDWVDFYGVLSPGILRFYKETMQKFGDYIYHVRDIARFTPDQLGSSAFHIAASACVVSGSNLGAWLDLIL